MGDKISPSENANHSTVSRMMYTIGEKRTPFVKCFDVFCYVVFVIINHMLSIMVFVPYINLDFETFNCYYIINSNYSEPLRTKS